MWNPKQKTERVKAVAGCQETQCDGQTFEWCYWLPHIDLILMDQWSYQFEQLIKRRVIHTQEIFQYMLLIFFSTENMRRNVATNCHRYGQSCDYEIL